MARSVFNPYRTEIIMVGDRVRYSDINLHYVGTLVSVERTPNGGDCLVQWDRIAKLSEEHSSNLARA